MPDKEPLVIPPLLDYKGDEISEKKYLDTLNEARRRNMEQQALRDDLVCCMETDNLETAQRLVGVADLSKYDSAGLLPIHYLALYDVSDEMFDLIYNNTSADDRLKPVNPAVYKKGEPQDFLGSSINRGDTVLHLIARNHTNEIVKKFCTRFHDYEDSKNGDDQTPLEIAIDFTNLDVVLFAINNEAEVTEEITEIARGLLFEAESFDESVLIYEALAGKFSISEEDIKQNVAQAEQYIAGDYEEEEHSDRSSSSSDSSESDEEESEEEISDRELKRRRVTQEGAAAAAETSDDSTNELEDSDNESSSPSPSPSNAATHLTNDKKRKR